MFKNGFLDEIDILEKSQIGFKVLFTQSLTFWNNLETIILSWKLEAETQLAQKQAYNSSTIKYCNLQNSD